MNVLFLNKATTATTYGNIISAWDFDWNCHFYVQTPIRVCEMCVYFLCKLLFQQKEKKLSNDLRTSACLSLCLRCCVVIYSTIRFKCANTFRSRQQKKANNCSWFDRNSLCNLFTLSIAEPKSLRKTKCSCYYFSTVFRATLWSIVFSNHVCNAQHMADFMESHFLRSIWYERIYQCIWHAISCALLRLQMI